jgi:hypothetical protein
MQGKNAEFAPVEHLARVPSTVCGDAKQNGESAGYFRQNFGAGRGIPHPESQ